MLIILDHFVHFWKKIKTTNMIKHWLIYSSCIFEGLLFVLVLFFYLHVWINWMLFLCSQFLILRLDRCAREIILFNLLILFKFSIQYWYFITYSSYYRFQIYWMQMGVNLKSKVLIWYILTKPRLNIFKI